MSGYRAASCFVTFRVGRISPIPEENEEPFVDARMVLHSNDPQETMTVSESETMSSVQNQTNGDANLMRIKLKASDGTVVEVDSDVAFKSILIEEMVKNLELTAGDPQLAEPLPLTNVDSNVLNKILEYCTQTRSEKFVPKYDNADPRITLSQWEIDYLKVDNDELMDMLMAANFLNIPGLLDIICQGIANMTDGKSVQELRDLFGLENDFTPEEEEEIRQRFEWVEQQ